MKSSKPSAYVRKRSDVFVKRTATRIWQEIPSADNPYIAAQSLCHGYDLIELMQKRSFVDVLYLLFRGELPSIDEAKLLETLMVSFINPGPRHPATRAAMNAGVGKTDPALILPIALTTLSGTYNAAGTLETAMRFLRKQQRQTAEEVASRLFEESEQPEEGDWHIAPGFGRYYSGIDLISTNIAEYLASLPGAGTALNGDSNLHRSCKRGNGLASYRCSRHSFNRPGFSAPCSGWDISDNERPWIISPW